MQASSPAEVVVARGHVQPVWAGHPWVFQQAMERSSRPLSHGQEVRVVDGAGNLLGRGFYSEGSALVVRLFTRRDEPFDARLLDARLAAAAARRAHGAWLAGTDGYRLVHGEGDGLPGLVVDRYGEVLVLQLGSRALAERRQLIVDALVRAHSPRAILDRSTEKAARLERFNLAGELAYGDAVAALRFRERELGFSLPVSLAQKTGFYFDQRPLRARVEELAPGREVLDLYGYVGAAGLFAARGGAARVVSVDSSAAAQEVGVALAEQCGLGVEFVRADALRFLAEHPRAFDLVLSDPPKLAPSRGGRMRAQGHLRKVAAASLAATRPGGILALSSCSAALGQRELERTLALAARDMGREATVLERLFQGPDHPVPPAFPEGLYLSTLLAQVD
jgi:23S rRNA (cytosine1962-C5)-methyltransferase